ncbi:Phospho-2-dehydro-3-deoxyheptonate aldolase, phenylalanine-inhibited [Zancudomyces culisetae]|uniref:Phospho-2-dehydro-3-deoxyheptonate aldolase n=1 Tax=Zancudomyces culisetae TaxID=1213189 RepID=A0A1R1PKS4_ZANCU|nr:Phospho-2-dehydro-3-deoxyheptonate aldolase, phenylalanine-inhibited [Zancudomyces culisetae]|eukprot:OMH81537.1 Phospho-2-dehydro-3-deoxyheptonate aldolase, phenylalanine-inhibited [Zancudomyces culisetae]
MKRVVSTDSVSSHASDASAEMILIDDVNIAKYRPLIPPQILMEDLKVSKKAGDVILKGRMDAVDIIHGRDDRLLVIVGPCSIHDPQAALEYATFLKEYADTCSEELCIIMRAYFEKPRTTVGWKGLINDPKMDNSYEINKGLRIGRELLLGIIKVGLPAACEFLDTVSPQFIADLISWGAIGARTTESQVHRELSSGLSVPVGFKNGTDGNCKIALDAIKASQSSHVFLSVTKQGLTAIVETTGNKNCHLVLRGGNHGPNYDEESVINSARQLEKAGLNPRLMIDCSHGNSNKEFKRQLVVVEDIARQMADCESGNYICSVMIESNISEGRQDLPSDSKDIKNLKYGQSITDACIGWEDTVLALDTLRKGVIARRQRLGRA